MKIIKSSVEVINKNEKVISQFNNLINSFPLYEDIRIQDLLKQFTFTLFIKMNRLQSLLMVSRKYSFSIQSQRYCTYSKDLIEPVLDKTSDDPEIEEFINKSLDLYTKLINVGLIPNEDARDILPLCMPCNNTVTLNGLQLLDFVKLCILESDIMSNITNELLNIFDLSHYVSWVITHKSEAERAIVDQTIDNTFNYLYEERKDMKFDSNQLRKATIGALTCTHECSVDELNKIIGAKEGNGINKTIRNVALKCKHTSVLEHSVYSYATEMTLPAFNQFIRHRIQNLQTQSISTIIKSYLELDKISIFNKSTDKLDQFNDDIQELFNLSKKLIDKYQYLGNFTANFILFGSKIKIIITDNIANFCHIGQKRICNRAQYAVNHIVKEIYYKLIEKEPYVKEIIKELGSPDCIRLGKCHEGKPCGNNINIRDLFKEN